MTFSRMMPKLSLACAAALGAGSLALGGCASTNVPQSPGAAPGMGYTCSAGFYVCRMPQQVPLGQQCSCPGLGAPSYGTVQ